MENSPILSIPVNGAINDQIRASGGPSCFIEAFVDDGLDLPARVLDRLQDRYRAGCRFEIIAYHRKDPGINQAAALLKTHGFRDFAIRVLGQMAPG